MGKIGEVFISHTHADKEIAHALSSAIEHVFGDTLETVYSTKKEDGGIKHGEEWFQWIVNQVRTADIAVILLTPASTQKPWVLWEAGAVYGAGIASAESNTRKVRPVVFKLSGSQVPSPFAGIQAVHGDEAAGIERFLSDLIDDFGPKMERNQLVKAAKRLQSVIGEYLERVIKALHDAPLLPTEAAVQEWCERLDELAGENRLSEIGHLHDWLNLTFGRGNPGEDRSLPIDLRLHRRLGNAYRAAKRPDRAAQEFELALEFAPRDIYLLRSLGLAYLDGDRQEEATKVINRITELDKNAFLHNVECAALKARLQRKQNDSEGAATTYRNALEHNPDSYYLADVLGQTLLSLGKLDEARSIYSRAHKIIDGLAEQNIWTYATRVTASLVLNDEPRALLDLREIAARRPAADDLRRIEEGLERVRQSLNLEVPAFERWRARLRCQA
jgi:tetratricopeptide (TPR) repeat protein